MKTENWLKPNEKILAFLLLLPVLCCGLQAGTEEEAAAEMERLQQKYERKTFKQVRAEVKAGYTESAADLADLYYRGCGTKKNYKKAYKYYKKPPHTATTTPPTPRRLC